MIRLFEMCPHGQFKFKGNATDEATRINPTTLTDLLKVNPATNQTLLTGSSFYCITNGNYWEFDEENLIWIKQ